MSERTMSTTVTLPLFLTRQNKWPYGISFGLLATVLYMIANHFHITEPRLLPMSHIDEAVPFIPQTFWVYTSEYFLFISVYALCRDMANANKWLYSFFVLQAVSILIFFFWPTTFPREQFPIPDTVDSFTRRTFEAFRLTDSPANCCPSLHVSSVYLTSFVFLDEQRKKFPWFFGWASLIALATLTTKQHYFIDVVTGFGLALGCWYLFHRVISYRPINGDQPNR